jgi:membrane protein DedA with SNARE-associated domain
VHEFVQSLIHLDPALVILAVFVVAFLENLVPPLPSDVLVVGAGSLVGLGSVGFAEILVASSLGSTAGFIAMYFVGKWFGRRILAAGRIRFIPPEAVQTVEGMFERYGYWLIVVNRFLAGTRAVVAFFAGMSSLLVGRTVALSLVSALLWNAILIATGTVLGSQWERVVYYLSAYGQVVTGIVVVVVIVLVIRYVATRGRNRTQP